MMRTSPRRITGSSIIIDIVNPKTKKLMWRGVAKAEIIVEVSDREKQRRTNEVVRRLLRDFPPK